ncbi:hypothetical protein [Herbaspirillum huttiense]|uniref:hypothetical protein n=1 Tax=Herbaspirillum huttiense TaxID=863372 RepID=UPI0039AF0774
MILRGGVGLVGCRREMLPQGSTKFAGKHNPSCCQDDEKMWQSLRKRYLNFCKAMPEVVAQRGMQGYRFSLYPYPHSVFPHDWPVRIDFSHSSFRDGDCCVDRYHGRCVWQ